MASLTIPATPAESPLGRYRQAERALWEHYGVEPTERFVEPDAPRVRLRVLEVGSGEPVLFVHGTGGPGAWPSLVRELSGYRCLLLDRPGWGLSAPVDYSRHDYNTLIAALLSGLLDALGVQRAHVVGASIGNNWALRFAQRHPERVDRIVLLGAGPLVPDVPVPGFIKLLASPLGRIMVALPQKPKMVRSQLRAIGHGTSLDAGRIPDEFFDWRESMTRDTPSMRSERNMVRALVTGSSFRPGLTFAEGELATIRQPTLHLYGSEDPVGTHETWRRFARMLPDAELHLLDGAGHVPWFDDPVRVGRDITAFLAIRGN